MKAFIIEEKKQGYGIHPDDKDSIIYKLAVASTKEEIQKYRFVGAYEVQKKQLVEVFGLYLPFADEKNTKIRKTANGFEIDFSLKKDVKHEIRSLWGYVKRVLVALDQTANALLNGYEDESLSSRFYRWSLKKGILWKIPAILVDAFLFFDKAQDEDGRILRHCEKSFENELKRTGFPVKMR